MTRAELEQAVQQKYGTIVNIADLATASLEEALAVDVPVWRDPLDELVDAASAVVRELEACEESHGGLLIRDGVKAASRLRLALQGLGR